MRSALAHKRNCELCALINLETDTGGAVIAVQQVESRGASHGEAPFIEIGVVRRKQTQELSRSHSQDASFLTAADRQ